MRLRKFFLLWIILVIPPIFAAHYAPDIQRILNKGTLIIAMYHRDVPLMFVRSGAGSFQGVDIEMAHDIAKKLGVKVVFDRHYQTYNSIVNAIADHKADVAITFLSNTLSRSQRDLFTNPYLRIHMGLLINRKKLMQLKQTGTLVNILDAAHVKIAVLGKSAYVGMAKELMPHDIIIEYPSWQEMLAALKKGEVTAAFDNENRY